jgi:hypothetical protein
MNTYNNNDGIKVDSMQTQEIYNPDPSLLNTLGISTNYPYYPSLHSIINAPTFDSMYPKNNEYAISPQLQSYEYPASPFQTETSDIQNQVLPPQTNTSNVKYYAIPPQTEDSNIQSQALPPQDKPSLLNRLTSKIKSYMSSFNSPSKVEVSTITNNASVVVDTPTVVKEEEPVVENIKPTAASGDSKRIISYVDLTFSEEIKNARTYNEAFASLPQHVVRDVLRHLSRYSIIEGKVEKMLQDHNDNAINDNRYDDIVNVTGELKKINPQQFSLQPVGISPELVLDGETILKTHYERPVRTYSGKKELYEVRNKKCDEEHEKYRTAFTDYINKIKGTSLFYQYVYEQAKAANVQIEEWDKQFAEYNWNKEGMHMLSVQALERCLHSQK